MEFQFLMNAIADINTRLDNFNSRLTDMATQIDAQNATINTIKEEIREETYQTYMPALKSSIDGLKPELHSYINTIINRKN